MRYELHLTNFARDPLTLRRLQILDDATGREVAAISGDKLQKATRAVRLPPEGDTTVLVPGRLTLLYIDAVLPDVRNIERLRHRLHLSDGKLHFQVMIGHIAISKEEVVSIIEAARAAGAKIAVEPRETFWGGYSGYFRDPDGHLWEIAWHPTWSPQEAEGL